MADDTPSGVPTHRPLPSVDIPLLRCDVRAARQRKIAAALLVGCAIAALGASVIASSGPNGGPRGQVAPASPAVPLEVGYRPEREGAIMSQPDAGPAPPRPTEAAPTPPDPSDGASVVRTVRAFGPAQGFRPALIAAGLSSEEAEAITAALTGVLDFRRCRPEHEFVFERDAEGRLRRFEYRTSVTQIYEAVPEGSRWVGRKVHVPIERTRIARGGVVTTTLGAALEEAGIGRSLVGIFVETFEGRIDFNTETRAGDAFRILVDDERVNGQFLRYGTVWALEYRSRRRGALSAFWFDPRTPGSEGDFYDETGRAIHGGWLRTPLRYDHVSSPFDLRRMHPLLRRILPHTGIDYAAGIGTPVWAAADGEVTFVGPRGANGNLVILRHEGGYETFYAHLSRFASGLACGQRVRQRQIIGYVGSTGRSTGPHLHFALKRNGTFIDPARELNGPGRMLPPGQLGRFRQHLAVLRAELDRVPIPEVPIAEASAGEPLPPSPEDATD